MTGVLNVSTYTGSANQVGDWLADKSYKDLKITQTDAGSFTAFLVR